MEKKKRRKIGDYGVYLKRVMFARLLGLECEGMEETGRYRGGSIETVRDFAAWVLVLRLREADYRNGSRMARSRAWITLSDIYTGLPFFLPAFFPYIRLCTG